MADQSISQLNSLTTADQADVYAIVDISANETKKITEQNLEITIAQSDNFTDTLIANTNFTSDLANDSNFVTVLGNNDDFITELTNNATFQSSVNNFVTVGGGSGGAGGKPMTFAVSAEPNDDAMPTIGYVDREAIVTYISAGGGSTLTMNLMDPSGNSQQRDLKTDWAAAEYLGGYALIGSYLYVLLTDAQEPTVAMRVYRFTASDLSLGGTLMTISGFTLPTTGDLIGLLSSNGTDIYMNFFDGGSQTNAPNIKKFTISGTTLTFVNSTTCGSTPSEFNRSWAVDSSGNIYGHIDYVKQYSSAGSLTYTSPEIPGVNNDSDILNWANTVYTSSGGDSLFVKLYLPGTTDVTSGISTYTSNPLGYLVNVTELAVSLNTAMYVGIVNIPSSITVAKLSLYVTTVTASGTLDFSVYAEDGQRRLISGTTATISATGVVSTAVSSITLDSGNYYFAINSNATANIGITTVNIANIALNNAVTSEPRYAGIVTITAGTPSTTFNPTSDITAGTRVPLMRLDA